MAEQKLKELLLKLADAMKQLGHEYYDRNETDKTAIFWELEAVFWRLAQEEASP